MRELAQPVERVLVVGGGRAAWLCALGLARAFRRTGLSVTLVDTGESEPGHTVASAPADLARLHKLLGIEETDLVAAADAAPWLGQEWAGWGGEGSGFIHGFGEIGRPIAGLPFLPFWIKARARGMAVPLSDFVLAAAAARHGRLPDAAAEGVAPGRLLDECGHCQLLRERAIALGVEVVRDADPIAEVADGRIAALRLVDGWRMTADLYVDAGGPEGALIGALASPEDMGGAAAPCDRLLLASAPPLRPRPLYSRTLAHAAGWVEFRPLPSRTGVSFAYNTRHMSDEAATAALADLVGTRVAGAAVRLPLEDRVRRRPWVANCVALGEAAAVGSPLDAFDVVRDQVGVAHLLNLFPVNWISMRESALFNDLTVAHLDRLRDLQRVHFALNERRGEPFWDEARAQPHGEALQGKLDLFAARGIIPQLNHETMPADGWQALLIGHGVEPRSYDPQVDRIPDAQVTQELQAILRRIRDEVTSMPAAAA